MPQCKQCASSFEISDQDHAFYKKMDVPVPDLCIFCRREHLLIWRNQRTLYSRTCDKTGKQIISVFAPNGGYTVYDRDYWWGDAWDPCEYGMDFDFSRTFAEQYDALLHRVPMVAIFNGNSENSQYCNHVGEMKDCYLTFASWASQKSLYSDNVWGDDTCCDMLETSSCASSYQCVGSLNCFNAHYALGSERCNDSWFLYDCRDCTDCIGCTTLRNKQYCIFNVQYSPEEYKKKKEELRLTTRDGIVSAEKRFEDIRRNAIHKYANLLKCEDSTGDNLVGAKNSRQCFGMRENIVDCAYCINGGSAAIDCYDGYGVGATYERGYMSIDSGVEGNDYIFAIVVWGCQYAYYSFNCHASYEIIGCTGLRNKKYCILNKQYSKEEYETLKPKIIAHMKETGEWGQFLPPSIAPFAHNETLAHEYNQRTKEEALGLGFRWQDAMPGSYGKETIAGGRLGQTIDDAPPSLAQEILTCADCGRNYRIITTELAFYRSKKLPIPLLCPQCRYDARRHLRNPHQLWHRQCMCDMTGHDHDAQCTRDFETPYAPDRLEKVFCESCYQKEVL